MTPFNLRITRAPSLTGAIASTPTGYTVIVADGVLATAWTGTAADIDGAVALMTRIFRDRLVVG